ncbi:enoyl-CoA hydratase/isomerase [Luminiphilus syltensis NOR5-1B]|uniref:Enoyl-CoA hydratase/isomerase n=1 Tax=Luminiphilus syltensis NOR5-1B TaxID=565045 RepID=B8KQZ6_9GAMM|nr:enoyl-CoA hydratase-related protein [Luminiphilus syltensis]EED34139.1 enoyl-CoA hydratase/isomerase [Luminiphilus syltensis NOR5-1B]
MSDYETLEIQRIGSVAKLLLNRPSKMNTFNGTMRREFAMAARALNLDSSVRVVILGANGKAFSAGADLAEDPEEFGKGDLVHDVLNFEYKPGVMAVAEAPKPWIAAINGACAGVAYSYVMACDLVVMADNAFLYQPFAAIGLIPDGGSTWLLPQHVGSKRAFELMALGEKLRPEKAQEWGLINRVVSADALAEEALTLAQTLAEKSPLALRYTKAALKFSAEHGLADAIGNEAELQRVCIDSEDCQNAIAAFFEKRTPEWKGR